MLFFTLNSTRPKLWPMAPLRLLARSGGVYKLPILVHGIDFRFEDNKDCDINRAAGLTSTWAAKHPLDNCYLIRLNGEIAATHATSQFITVLQRCGRLPQDLYYLPDRGEAAWWEWTMCFNGADKVIKAPKVPHQYDPTPEAIDERYEPVLNFSQDEFYIMLQSLERESNQLLAEIVRTRAYYLWLEAGMPLSQTLSEEFWWRANSELIQSSSAYKPFCR